MSSKKLERQLNLIAALMESRQPLRADEIRTRVSGYPEGGSAFHRAFERDKDDLRAMGVDIVVEDIRSTDPPTLGYRLPAESTVMDDPDLTPDELAALHLAASIVRLEGMEDDSGLWKLGGLRAGPSVVPALSAEVPAPPALVSLFEAVSDGRTAAFTYRDARRSVDPERLEYRRGRWYLVGFDHDRGETRSFRVDRMGEELDFGAPGSAEPRGATGGPRSPWAFDEGPEECVELAVDALVAPVVRSELPDAELVEVGEDGSLRLRVRLTRWEPFRSYVLSYLDRVEVLEPSWARRDVIDWLTAVAAS